MIGIYRCAIRYDEKPAQQHLLAYDIRTEKMRWGIPLLEGKRPYIDLVGESLFIRYNGTKDVHIVDADTGTITSTLELPYAITDESSGDVHFGRSSISPPLTFFCYLLVTGYQTGDFFCGEVSDGKPRWMPPSKPPCGEFRPLGTYCAFQDDFERAFIICSPKDGQTTLTNCVAAMAYQDTLYTIEKQSVTDTHCYLMARTLDAESKNFVSPFHKSIRLNVPEASFAKQCQHNEKPQVIILFAEAGSHSCPIFVNMNSENVIYSSHAVQCYGTYVIGTMGDLWTWDAIHKTIWRILHTDRNVVMPMGTLTSGRGTLFLHADDDIGRVYFVDIPF